MMEIIILTTKPLKSHEFNTFECYYMYIYIYIYREREKTNKTQNYGHYNPII